MVKLLLDRRSDIASVVYNVSIFDSVTKFCWSTLKENFEILKAYSFIKKWL